MIERLDRSASLEAARQLVGALPSETNLVVDTTDALERAETDASVAFLDELEAAARDGWHRGVSPSEGADRRGSQDVREQ